MWLGICWVCHVGDTATNMTLALWMWNNTWQAELLISNHLLSWYASDSVVQLFLYNTVFILWSSPRQMLSIGEKWLLPLMHSSKNCPTESDSAFCAFFQSARCWSTFQTIPPQHTSTICPKHGRCAPFLPRGSLFRDVSTFRGHVVRQGMGGCWCDIKSSCM